MLRGHGVTALADVRSIPYSRWNPQFNRENIERALEAEGIVYMFLGKELGGRSEDPACQEDGHVRYGRLARTDLFRRGVDRIREEAGRFRLALMCAEREPLECHRTILVARQLASLGYDIHHIHSDGRLESHGEAIDRLIRVLGLAQGDMFRSRQEMVEEAYRRQGERIG